jgi:hypothetical protein
MIRKIESVSLQGIGYDLNLNKWHTIDKNPKRFFDDMTGRSLAWNKILMLVLMSMFVNSTSICHLLSLREKIKAVRDKPS